MPSFFKVRAIYSNKSISGSSSFTLSQPFTPVAVKFVSLLCRLLQRSRDSRHESALVSKRWLKKGVILHSADVYGGFLLLQWHLRGARLTLSFSLCCSCFLNWGHILPLCRGGAWRGCMLLVCSYITVGEIRWDTVFCPGMDVLKWLLYIYIMW